MAFNFPNGVPKFPAGVKSRPSPSAGRPQSIASPSAAVTDHASVHPLAKLPREDQDLIVQLVLRSGSLKDLASAYEVSYPTIRIRLDRVIERLRVVIAGDRPGGVAELLARMVERGKISPDAAGEIGEAVRTQMLGTGHAAIL